VVSLRVVAALLWGSGFCALFYQTAWQRMFRLSFGASTAASAAVLAIFLGGLGVGGLALGRRAQRHERPLLFYGNLELGVAVAAAVSPFLEAVLGRLYLALGGVTVLGQAGATVVRLLITAVVIGPGAFLMGGTLPAAARAVESDGDRARSRLALLYGMNTLGAVTGALVGTFFLFEFLGIRLSLLAAVLVNVLVGIAARSMGRTAAVLVEPPRSEPSAHQRPRALAVLGSLVAGFVGFAFLLLEIVWYRLLAPILGGTTYTFGLVLAVALAGIGLGGYLYSLRDPERRVAPSDLALVTALEGVLVALPIALGDRIAFYAILTRPISSLGFVALVFAWFTITLVVVFPAALVSGYQFPMLFALLGSGRDRVARHVGIVYAFNTAGALVGSLLGGFVLVPRLGAIGAYRLVAGVLLVLAVVSVGFEWARGKTTTSGDAARDAVAPRASRSIVAFALVALGAVFASQAGPSAVFRHMPIGAGRVELAARTTNQLRAFVQRQNQSVLWQADGVETTVALGRDVQLSFIVDGKCDGAVYSDRATQAGAGLIAALVHPAPRSSLVIGLGTGMTAGFLSAIPGMERVDVAEMEPAILHVARVAAKANNDVLSRPNVFVHLGDGRELVLSAKRRYDVIASEPSNPYRAGVASLYTREFYEAVAEHLEQDGVFLQWVQGYETDTRTVQIVARTLSGVLPNLDAWQTEAGDIVFIAGRKHRVLDSAALRRRLADEPFRSVLPRTMLIEDLEGVLGRYLASEALLAHIAQGPLVETNTDDRNVIEYAFARNVGASRAGVSDSLLLLAMKQNQDRPDVVGSVDWERVAALRPRAWSIADDALPRLPMPTEASRSLAGAITAGCQGNVGAVFTALGSTRAVEARDDIERWVLGLAFADANDERAAPYADRLASHGFAAEAHVLRARKALAAGDVAMAQAETDAGIVAMRQTPFPLCRGVDSVLALAATIGAAHPEYRGHAALELLESPFATYIGDAGRLSTAEQLAIGSGDPALCVKAMAKEPRWEEPYLVKRLQCLAAAGDPETEAAAQDLLEFRAATAGDFDPRPGQ
jgi:spermidine synthase